MRGPFRWFGLDWARARPVLLAASVLLFILTFYFWRLGTYTTGLGLAEYQSRQNSMSLQQIFDKGINAPYFLTQHFVAKLHSGSFFFLRLSSVLIAVLVLVCLYKLLSSLFGQKMAFFGFLVFLSTPWLVLTSRSATPDIMYLWPIVLLSVFYWLLKSKGSSGLLWVLLCGLGAIALYVPGLVWLMAISLIFLRRQVSDIRRRVSRPYFTAGIVTAIILVVPLVVAVVTEPNHIKELMLIPRHWPAGIEIIKSIAWSASSIFWRTRDHVDINIDYLPILTVLQIVLVVFGAYALGVKARRSAVLLGGLLLFSVVAAGLNQNPHLLAFGLPALAIYMVAGLRFLYVEWRRVFPLNPFSHALALSLICLVVGMQVFYGLRYSLIAWPHTPATKNTHVLK